VAGGDRRDGITAGSCTRARRYLGTLRRILKICDSDFLSESLERRRFLPKFAVVMGCTSLLATFLHGIEAAIWADTYRFLGALPDNRSAMLYSVSAMTAYGHASLFLKLSGR